MSNAYNKGKVVPSTCLHCYTSKPQYIMYALLGMKIYGTLMQMHVS